MDYSVRCIGERLPGSPVEQVVERLQANFSLSVDEAEALLDGRFHFVRDGLDSFTAHHYRDLFHDIGLQLKIEGEQQSVPAEADDPAHCPNCGATPSSDESCPDCGIYYAKLLARRERQEQTIAAEQGLSDADYEQLSQRARLWLRIGGALFSITFILDDYLSILLSDEVAGIYVGYFPYLLAILCITIGSIPYVRLKGFPGWLGGVGLTGMFGIGILLLLPDRRGGEQLDLRRRHSLFGLTILVVGCWWLTGTVMDQTVLRTLERLGQELRQGRSEYPNTQLDSRIQPEQDELFAYLERGFKLLEGGALRPDQVERFGRQMFSEISHYLIWVDYQRYLHVTKTGELPPIFIQGARPLQKLYDTARRGTAFSQSETLQQLFERWFKGTPKEEELEWIGDALDDMSRTLKQAASSPSRRELRHSKHKQQPPRRPLSTVEAVAALPDEFAQGEIVQREQGRITLRIPYQGRMTTLVMAFFARPGSHNGRPTIYNTLLQIGGDFPNAHLSNGMHHFRDWASYQ